MTVWIARISFTVCLLLVTYRMEKSAKEKDIYNLLRFGFGMIVILLLAIISPWI